MRRLIALSVAMVCVGVVVSAWLSPPAPAAQGSNPQMSSANYALDWSAVGEISGGASTSTNYRLIATIGQMAANAASVSPTYGLCTGFECLLANVRNLFLPLVVH
jgi:hypothetical protein